MLHTSEPIFVLLMIACSSKVKLIEDNRERKPERKILSRRVKRTVQFIFSSKKEVQFGLGFYKCYCYFIRIFIFSFVFFLYFYFLSLELVSMKPMRIRFELELPSEHLMRVSGWLRLRIGSWLFDCFVACLCVFLLCF